MFNIGPQATKNPKRGGGVLMQWMSSDTVMVVRGFLLLILIVAVGVVIAEKQLNDLTLQEDSVKTLNIKRDEASGVYVIYLLGSSYRLKGIYQLAKIDSQDNALIVASTGRDYTVPMVINIDFEQTRYWLTLWRRQFLREALQTKLTLTEYWLALEASISNSGRVLWP